MLMISETKVGSSAVAWIGSLRVQSAANLLIAVALPALFRFPDISAGSSTMQPLVNSIVAAAVAALFGIILFRRVTAFPGVRSFGYIVPSFATSYGLVILAMFGLRIDYSRFYLAASFLLALAISYLGCFLIDRFVRRRFFLIGSGDAERLLEIEGIDWIVLHEPKLEREPRAKRWWSSAEEPLVADLRFDHDAAWERLIANAAISGRPVYHSKQLRESLTGKVSIEHLSENSFGSLVPNLVYAKLKRATDLAACALLLPFAVIPMLCIAIAIRLDSGSPVMFRQDRVGYRGKIFRIWKFRTMHNRLPSPGERGARLDAMTQAEDDRVTKVGRFLRRSRLDELPQIFNVLRGEMSLIGPRPEAVVLSRWYEAELPFYTYRHIVRPGLTGWAQVHQGHVTDLGAIDEKLKYDFYYIKNFSAWLDILITLRTIPTMLSGFGSR